MGDAQVQTTAGQTRQGMGVVSRCSTARPQALRALADAPTHLQPTCGSRMTGDCHVRFCESRGGETPPGYSPTPADVVSGARAHLRRHPRDPGNRPPDPTDADKPLLSTHPAHLHQHHHPWGGQRYQDRERSGLETPLAPSLVFHPVAREHSDTEPAVVQAPSGRLVPIFVAAGPMRPVPALVRGKR